MRLVHEEKMLLPMHLTPLTLYAELTLVVYERPDKKLTVQLYVAPKGMNPAHGRLLTTQHLPEGSSIEGIRETVIEALQQMEERQR